MGVRDRVVVGELDRAIGAEQQVARLHVAMEDLVRVRVGVRIRVRVRAGLRVRVRVHVAMEDPAGVAVLHALEGA